MSIDTVALLPYIINALKELHENILQFNKLHSILDEIIEIDAIIKDVLKSCGYEMNESHTFVANGLIATCSKCGYLAKHFVPIIKNKKEEELEVE